MRAAKVLAVLAIAALGIGSFSAVAQAGNRDPKKTTVNFANQSPSFNSGKVSANGQVVSHCGGMDGVPVSIGPVSMILQVLDTNGVVLTTLDGSTSDVSGNWTLSGQLPKTLPTGTNSVRVKAKKRAVGKFVCQAGVSPNVAIPAT